MSDELVQLGNLVDVSDDYVSKVTDIIGVPRDVLPTKSQIQTVCSLLPREIMMIPPAKRDALILKMCIASSVGLFDGAINYIWDSVVINLRDLIRKVGFNNVGSVTGKDFTETTLKELNDSGLLDLLRQLGLLTEEGYYFLNQCRDMRNNISIAHPSIATVDDLELLNFINRCCKYGLNENIEYHGIDINKYIATISKSQLDNEQIQIMSSQIEETYPSQKSLMAKTLHGMYCDSKKQEYVRINCLEIIKKIKSDNKLENNMISSMISNHDEYKLLSDSSKLEASRAFINKTGLISYLSNNEQEIMFRKACNQLKQIHLGFDNFYNEPIFAERLLDLSTNIGEIPNSCKSLYVNVVLMCYIGNEYGISNAAEYYYEKMIVGFRPQELNIMLHKNEYDERIQGRLKYSNKCLSRYQKALKLINVNSLTAEQNNLLEKLLKE